MKTAEITMLAVFCSFDLRDQSERKQQNVLARCALDELAAEQLRRGVRKTWVSGRAEF